MAGQETKWTGSRWMQDEDSPCDISLDDRAAENVTPLIASINTEGVSDEQWQADARLIVAAPDLYATNAAITELVGRLCTIIENQERDIGHEPIDPLLKQLGPAHEASCKALARARGEDS